MEDGELIMKDIYFELEDETMFKIENVESVEKVTKDWMNLRSFSTGYRLVVKGMDARSISKEEFDQIRNKILTK